jgi:phosphorylated CTD-interacting factor 1
MPKKVKKRSRPVAATSDELFHLTGLRTGTTRASSLENCMEELESSFAPASPNLSEQDTRKKTKSKAEDEDASCEGTNTNKLWDPDLVLDARWPTASQAEASRITNWNTAFQRWISQGTYTAGLLPSFDVELARHFQVKELSSFLLKSCSSLKMPSFERWLLDSKLEENRKKRQTPKSKGFSSLTDFATLDPILSGTVTIDFESSQRLIAEMVEASEVSTDEAKTIVQELCRRTFQTAVPQVHADSRRCADQTPLKKDRIDIERRDSSISLIYHKKRWKKPFCVKLNLMHYEKLRGMFLRVHSIDDFRIKWKEIDGKQTKATHAFHLLLMVLVLRYSSLSGGQLLNDLRGGGMQGAIHGEVFGVLRETFSDCNLMECFASPFNAYLPYFQSAFPNDIDWHFGSTGDFLDDDVESFVTEGCLEANPPFSPGLMDAMVDRIEQSLFHSDAQKKALTVVIIVPTADTTGEESTTSMPVAKRCALSSFGRMTSSVSCQLHIVLSAREHGYVEGAQHLRPTRYKDSSYDTSVIVLQSLLARKQELNKEDFENKIRTAFKSRHTEELQQRRQEGARKKV